MPIDVEVNLRIPSLTLRSEGNKDVRVDNSSVRYSKRISVEGVPKPGDRLMLSTRSGSPFECTVSRSDWHEEKNLFVVSCAFARRSITPEEHSALQSDPDWSPQLLP
jgi:hypothetical protein